MSSFVETEYKREAAKLLEEGFIYDANENRFIRQGGGVTEIVLLRYLWHNWQRFSHKILKEPMIF